MEARTNSHASRTAIGKYGMTPGCAGCSELARRGSKPGKLIYHHSDTCRARIIEHMKDDLEYRRRLEKHGHTMAMSSGDVMTKEEIREKMHQVQTAIMEIERRQRQMRRSAKEEQINNMIKSILLKQMVVAEVYSPLRIADMAHKFCLRAGWSLDLTTCDENGEPLGFKRPPDEKRCSKEINTRQIQVIHRESHVPSLQPHQ